MRPRSIRNDRQASRGQVMLLFALMSVLLLVIAGLAIDAGMSYFSSDQVERAAAAGALAGVAYLPGDFSGATNAALVEVARNNFASACPTTTTPAQLPSAASPCVIVEQPTNTTNELEVIVSVTVPTTFLRLLGFGPHLVQRTATAEYLPPIALGQPGSSQGSALVGSCNGVPPSGTYCANPGSGLGSGGSNFYFERTEGWGNPRSEGDAYTPTPDDNANSCPPQTSCEADPQGVVTLDKHALSPASGTEQDYRTEYPALNLDMNYTGGSNYLIAVPPGQSVDVQIFNPAFAPDANDQNGYSYHEDDSSFPNNSTTATNFSAMSYTVFTVPTLSSDMTDSLVSQEVFYPYNATCLYNGGSYAGCQNSHGVNTESYTWFPPSGLGTATPVNNEVPATYHEWISGLDYTPSHNDAGLETTVYTTGASVLSDPFATSDAYYRLEVDTLQWDGSPTCTATSCSFPAVSSNTQSKAHKGYAVQLAVPNTTTACSASTCSSASISAMDDMTIYTPIVGAQCPSFQIPLFYLDPAYAGQTIDVDLFDVGDVSGGNAYVGIVPPASTGITPASCASSQPSGLPSGFAQLAPSTQIDDIGTSLSDPPNSYIGEANAAGVTGVDSAPKNPTPGAADAVIQTETAASNGTSLWNGQWLQFQIQVPPGYNPGSACTNAGTRTTNCYWDLYYSVSSSATAGDTFSVQVGFNGSPDRLLP
jgi:hypothetical protein